MLSFKALAGKIITSDAKLFAIKLKVSKATNIDIEHIILMTDSLSSARKIVDLIVYSEQAYSLAVCSALRLYFVVILAIR